MNIFTFLIFYWFSLSFSAKPADYNLIIVIPDNHCSAGLMNIERIKSISKPDCFTIWLAIPEMRQVEKSEFVKMFSYLEIPDSCVIWNTSPLIGSFSRENTPIIIVTDSDWVPILTDNIDGEDVISKINEILD
jgi:hypothetical protein